MDDDCGGSTVGDDEAEIGRTLAEYSQLCDDGRFDEWASLFTEDASFVVAGKVTEGRSAIRSYMAELQPAEARGKHIISNSLVELDGARAAVTTDYLFVRRGTDGLGILAAGRYYDRLVRHDRRWRFHRRTITMLGDPPPDDDGPGPRA
jgi:uncharacterized protein (TIGR02246 family)